MSNRAWFQTALVLSVLLATGSAAMLAYGADPYWAQFRHGMGLILFTYRLQWVLATIAILFCLATVGLIVGGRRRIFWLIALGPVLALFVHRFVANPMREYSILEDPPCAKPDAANQPADADYVVGVQLGDQSFAYPYASLYRSPVVLQSSHEQRFILIWSAGANRATAFKVDREIKRGELGIVASPANALLIYNGRVGQFINGLTGETTQRTKPTGFHAAVPAQKVTWAGWRKMHPTTLVLPTMAKAPATAIRPSQPIPGSPTSQPVDARIIFAPTTQPVAIPADLVDFNPANVSAGSTQLLLFHDRQTGVLRAFDRRVQEDLFPLFRRKTDPKRPLVALEDQDSGTEWSADGKAIDGPFKGEQLKPVQVEDDLYWGVMKYWYPELQWVAPIPMRGGPGNFKNQADSKRRKGK